MYKDRNTHNPDTTCSYSSDLSLSQALLVQVNLEGALSRLRKYTPVEIINAIAYVLKTGCQWPMLPLHFPKWKTVYHHFRSLSDSGWFRTFLKTLVGGRRASLGLPPEAAVCVVDSQSVRSALPQTEKGVDGNKRIKGIKRHVAVDPNGYVLGAFTTTANIHDSKGAIPLLANILHDNIGMELVKADLGYKGLRDVFGDIDGIFLDCVKSNFGSPDFIPIEGRWVVERTFSWMENYRRLTRNYEKLLKVAAHMFIAGCVFFMLRYFR